MLHGEMQGCQARSDLLRQRPGVMQLIRSTVGDLPFLRMQTELKLGSSVV